MMRASGFAAVTARSIVLSIAWTSMASAVDANPTPIYVNINCHNEESSPPDPNYLDPAQFAASRELVRLLADTISTRGARFNFQSDWKFLLACIRFDAGTPSTNGKNLIRWMSEDKGIEIDPHSHHMAGGNLGTYLYADVAKLIDSLGVPTSLNTGGFVALDTTWQVLEDGIYGRQFPRYFWKPDVIWGGGSPNHVDDVNTYGAWKPLNGRSMAEFMTHDPDRHLTLIGNGCAYLIRDTTVVANAVANIAGMIEHLRDDPPYQNRFYSASFQVNVRDLDATMIRRTGEVIGALQPYADASEILWTRLTDKLAAWQDVYGSQPNFVACGDNTVAVPEPAPAASATGLWIGPNPIAARSVIGFSLPARAAGASSGDVAVRLELFDTSGRRVRALWNGPLRPGEHRLEFDARGLPVGVYYCRLTTPRESRAALVVRVR